jgi:transcriptional regulator with XRE-family HTH domain
VLRHLLFSLRVHAGLTQHELATAIGHSPSYISMLESGHRTRISKAVYRRLAVVLQADAALFEQAMRVDTQVLLATCAPRTASFGPWIPLLATALTALC